MRLSAAQDRMRVWASDVLDTTDPMMAALKLAEEVGEVCGAIVKPADGSGRPCGDPMEELADVVLAALTCAVFLDGDLSSAVESKLVVLEQRALF